MIILSEYIFMLQNENQAIPIPGVLLFPEGSSPEVQIIFDK